MSALLKATVSNRSEQSEQSDRADQLQLNESVRSNQSGQSSQAVAQTTEHTPTQPNNLTKDLSASRMKSVGLSRVTADLDTNQHRISSLGHGSRALSSQGRLRATGKAIANALIRLWISVAAHYHRRSTIRSLSALSDQLLNDIGIDESGIHPLADSLAMDYQERELARRLLKSRNNKVALPATWAKEQTDSQLDNAPVRLNRVRLYAYK